MIRKTLTIALLTAAAGVLAAGTFSYWRGVPSSQLWITGQETHAAVRATFVSGQLHAVYALPTSANGPAASTPPFGRVSQAQVDEWQLGPFYARRLVYGSAQGFGGGAPFWAVGTVLLIPPATAFLRGPWRRHRRRVRNQCMHCGYLLTGLTEARCPECGTRFKPRAGPAETAGNTRQATA